MHGRACEEGAAEVMVTGAGTHHLATTQRVVPIDADLTDCGAPVKLEQEDQWEEMSER